MTPSDEKVNSVRMLIMVSKGIVLIMLSWGVKMPKTLSRTGVVGNWKPWNLT
jgi:hypothetical protein